MSSPQVSVILPALNAQEFIATALESALSQEGADLEVIVVDDGSSDATLEKAEAFARRDPRVRTLRHASTRGVSVARNTGIVASRGEWIALLDADDAYASGRIAYLLEGAHSTAADLIADNLMLCSFPARHPIEPALRPGSVVFSGPLTLAKFIAQEGGGGDISLGFLKPLIRRAFIERHRLAYREDLRVIQDFALYVECLLLSARFILLPEPLYLYSCRQGSLSNSGSLAPMAEVERLNREILDRFEIQMNPQWCGLFRKRQRRIERMIVSASFAEALKGRRILLALALLSRHPRHAAACVNRVSAAGLRRWSGVAYRPRGMQN